jgi:hypothetical protein
MMQAPQTVLRWTSSIDLMAKILVLGILLSGCASVMESRPNLPTYQPTVVETLSQKYSKPESIPTDLNKLTADQRNNILEDLIFLIDVNYHQFENDLYKGRALFDTTTDLAIIALGAAGALIDASGTQAILAAISTTIGGGRVSINKNYFREQSTNALISTMRASRKAKLNFIRDAETLSISEYPMSRALVDIVDYYNIGTIVGAFESIVSEAGEKERKNTKEIEQKVRRKTFEFKTGPLRTRIERWIDSDIDKNLSTLQGWLTKKKVTTDPNIWVSAAPESDLKEAISALNIPE